MSSSLSTHDSYLAHLCTLSRPLSDGQLARSHSARPQARQGTRDYSTEHVRVTNTHRYPQIALLAFHGINHHTSARIMARLQFHDQLRVADLSEPQLNALSALLSAPAAAPRPSTPLRPFSVSPCSTSNANAEPQLLPRDPPPAAEDPITGLLIEEDLRRQMRADIAHHRTIGNLTGRQHAMGLPVRGQRNKTNGRTAKRLNRIERRGFTSSAGSSVVAGGAGYVSAKNLIRSDSR